MSYYFMINVSDASFNRYVSIFELLLKKKTSMLADRVVCCLHQSDRRIWINILHLLDRGVKVCLSHQSDCRILTTRANQSSNFNESTGDTERAITI